MPRREVARSGRREPKQVRAIETTERVFEAAARIIERDDPLTTNHIAAEAGISIGALYSYFPNKDAILLAMARRELRVTNDAVVAAARMPDGGAQIGRPAIRALMRGFSGRNRLRKVLIEAVIVQGKYADLAQPVAAIAELMMRPAGRAGGKRGEGLTEAQAFVLTQAVIGVIRAATLGSSALMGSTALEDELVSLTESYVANVRRRKRSSVEGQTR